MLNPPAKDTLTLNRIDYYKDCKFGWNKDWTNGDVTDTSTGGPFSIDFSNGVIS